MRDSLQPWCVTVTDAVMRDWDEHRLILTLHRYGTLRAAGEALNVTHTTVARRLAALNDSEPDVMFTRQDRAYVATAYGLERVALAERMEALDEAATRLRRSTGEGLSGPLSLSVPQAILKHILIKPLGRFVSDHPDIDLTIVGTDRLSDLERGEADVVLRGHDSPPDNLIGRRLCTVGVSEYARADYLRRTPVEARQWIASSQTADWIHNSSHPDAHVGVIIHDIQSRFMALEAGLGMSRAACFMADAHPDLVRLDDRPTDQLYGLWVLTHPDLHGTPKVKALMTALSDAVMSSKDRIEGLKAD